MLIIPAESAIEHHEEFRVAVSGGSLPKVLAQALLNEKTGKDRDIVQYDKWHIFFADERAVPLDHDEGERVPGRSCYG